MGIVCDVHRVLFNALTLKHVLCTGLSDRKCILPLKKLALVAVKFFIWGR